MMMEQVSSDNSLREQYSLKTHALDAVESCRGVSTTAGAFVVPVTSCTQLLHGAKKKTVWVWGSYSVMGKEVGQL